MRDWIKSVMEAMGSGVRVEGLFTGYGLKVEGSFTGWRVEEELRCRVNKDVELYTSKD